VYYRLSETNFSLAWKDHFKSDLRSDQDQDLKIRVTTHITPQIRVLNGGPISLPKSGSQIGVPNRGPKLGPKLMVPNQGPKSGFKSGSQIRVLNWGPK
jgi:hypothetical protein